DNPEDYDTIPPFSPRVVHQPMMWNDGSVETADYPLANQPTYSVPMGPVSLYYAGAKVSFEDSYWNSEFSSCLTNAGLAAFSGWAAPSPVKASGGGLGDDTGMFKGFLALDRVLVRRGAIHHGTLGDCHNGVYVYRYRYIGPHGADTVEFVQSPAEALITAT